MTKPKLAELLELENPYPTKGAIEDCFCGTCKSARAWNRALEDVWERMGAVHFKEDARRYILAAGPGYWVWIPDKEPAKCSACSDKELVYGKRGEIEWCPSCRPIVGAACV